MKTTKSFLRNLVITFGLSLLLTGCGDKDKMTGHGTSAGLARNDAIAQLDKMYSSYDIVDETGTSEVRGHSENSMTWDCTCTIYVKNAHRHKD
jgi:hypothetical protein